MHRFKVFTQYSSPLGGGVYETVAPSEKKALANVRWQVMRHLGVRYPVTKYWQARISD